MAETSNTSEKTITGKLYWIVRSGLLALAVVLVVMGFLFQHFLGHDKLEVAQEFEKTVALAQNDALAPADLALVREMSALASRPQASLAAVTTLSVAGENALANRHVSKEERQSLTLLCKLAKDENAAVSWTSLGRLLNEHPEIKRLLEHPNLTANHPPQDAAATTATAAGPPK